jgi:hypothetical protein
MRSVATVPVLYMGDLAAKHEWNGKSRTKRGKLCDLKSFSLAGRPHQRGSVKKKRMPHLCTVSDEHPSCRVASQVLCGLPAAVWPHRVASEITLTQDCGLPSANWRGVHFEPPQSYDYDASPSMALPAVHSSNIYKSTK